MVWWSSINGGTGNDGGIRDGEYGYIRFLNSRDHQNDSIISISSFQLRRVAMDSSVSVSVVTDESGDIVYTPALNGMIRRCGIQADSGGGQRLGHRHRDGQGRGGGLGQGQPGRPSFIRWFRRMATPDTGSRGAYAPIDVLTSG